jgi:hypothetical protein
MIHGLLLAAAIDATAPTDADVEVRPREDSFGRAGSVVLGEVIAARYGTGPSGLGGIGSQVGTGWLSFGSTKTGDMTFRSIQLEPSFDVFVANGLSIGATVGGGVGSYELGSGSPGGDNWYVTAVPRIGETITLSRDVAVWIRAGAGMALGDGTAYPRMGVSFRATFDVPFVFTITKHIALQAGPHLVYFNQLAGPPDGHGFVGGASAGLSIVL